MNLYLLLVQYLWNRLHFLVLLFFKKIHLYGNLISLWVVKISRKNVIGC